MRYEFINIVSCNCGNEKKYTNGIQESEIKKNINLGICEECKEQEILIKKYKKTIDKNGNITTEEI